MLLLPAEPFASESQSYSLASLASPTALADAPRSSVRAVPAARVVLDGNRLKVDLFGRVDEGELLLLAGRALGVEAEAEGLRARLEARLAEAPIASVVVTQAALSPAETGALMAVILSAAPSATVVLSGGGDKPASSRPRAISMIVPAGDPAHAGSLKVAADGTWFESNGHRIDLANRPTLCRILAALGARAGTTVTSTELMDAGWPGERILRAAGLARVRVAMSTLRAMGLRVHLRSSRSGHALVGNVESAA